QPDAIENLAKCVTGRASGVTDQTDAQVAPLDLRENRGRSVDCRWQNLDCGTRIRLFERLERGLVGDFELQSFQEMIDLRPAGNVPIGLPVQFVATMPQPAVRHLDLLRSATVAALAQNALHTLEAKSLLSPGQFGRIGDERFPQI